MSSTGAKKQAIIQQPVVYRGTAKKDVAVGGYIFRKGDVYYRVKSDSEERWYTVFYEPFMSRTVCTCPAYTEDCKHVRACLEVAEARRELRKQAKAPAYDVVKEAAQVVEQAEVRASVNG